ncbi:MAG: hypothetical protein HC849_08695 [Oscillatoriales cyanobacterium RU_3_3]|nr:hypothetical protein [Oscillatoriales cyanobacterium RU_3_3]
MSDHNDVPLMFQAQVAGRSQIHKLEDLGKKAQELGVRQEDLRQQAYDWVEEWQEACDSKNVPAFSKTPRSMERVLFHLANGNE